MSYTFHRYRSANFCPGTQLLKRTSRWLVEECEYHGVEEEDGRVEVEEIPETFRIGSRHGSSSVQSGHRCQRDRDLNCSSSVWAVLSWNDFRHVRMRQCLCWLTKARYCLACYSHSNAARSRQNGISRKAEDHSHDDKAFTTRKVSR